MIAFIPVFLSEVNKSKWNQNDEQWWCYKDLWLIEAIIRRFSYQGHGHGPDDIENNYMILREIDFHHSPLNIMISCK